MKERFHTFYTDPDGKVCFLNGTHTINTSKDSELNVIEFFSVRSFSMRGISIRGIAKHIRRG